MDNVINLIARRNALQEKIRQQIDITGFDVVGKNHLEIVICDGGEVKVLQLKRKSAEEPWTCVSKLMEEIIEEVLNEQDSGNTDQ